MVKIYMKHKREVGIEVLRLLAMFMVTVLHVLGHGGILDSYVLATTGYHVFWLIEAFCIVAVNCFVLISGYFLCEMDFRVTRVIRFITQTLFYSVVCLLITKFCFRTEFSLVDAAYCLVPLSSGRYWFMTNYVVLLLISPILNICIANTSKEQLKKIVILMILVFSVIPTFFIWSRGFLGYGAEYTWFVVLYLVAAYIRKYGFAISAGKSLAIYSFFAVMTYGTRIIIALVSKAVLGEELGAGIFYEYNSVFSFAGAVMLFNFFRQVGIRNKYLVKLAKLGGLSIGAYLITDHKIIRESVWNMIGIQRSVSYGVLFTLCNVLIIAIVIVLIGCIIEFIRVRVEFFKINRRYCK